MKKLSIMLLVGLSIWGFRLTAQVQDAPQRMRDQAIKMGQALSAGDYKTFVAYSHPYVLQVVGGAAKMEAGLKQMMDGLKQQGVSLGAITVDAPSKIVKSGKELQATIGQHTMMNTPNGKVPNASILLAFSEDNGVSWKFLDTHNKSVADIRKVIPNLSPEISLPAAGAQGH